jgi:plastocyanin
MKRFAIGLAALVFAALPAWSQDGGWGTIKGRVVWGPKEIPERTPIDAVKNNADKAHCLKDGPVLSEQWVVNPKTRGLQWTFVWLINEDPKNKAPLPIHPSLKEVKKEKVDVDQPVCAFIPHALAVREGQNVVAKNSSPVTHNIKWTGAKNQGNVNLPPGASFEIKDLKAERLPMQIECNIHPWMNGRVGIFDHPYFALTDENGNFVIKNAPAGKFRVVFYNNSYNGGAPGRNGVEVAIPPDGTLDMGEVTFNPPPPSKE